jgi:hypothetical protein
VTGLPKERCPLPTPSPSRTLDSGYGLFLPAFLVFGCGAMWFFFPDGFGESDEEDLRFASRFIHPVKGRLRVCRSFAMNVSSVFAHSMKRRERKDKRTCLTLCGKRGCDDARRRTMRSRCGFGGSHSVLVLATRSLDEAARSLVALGCLGGGSNEAVKSLGYVRSTWDILSMTRLCRRAHNRRAQRAAGTRSETSTLLLGRWRAQE